MSFKEIKEKLINGDRYKKLLDRIDGRSAGALKLGYEAGVIDTIEELKKAGYMDIDFSDFDTGLFDFSEADKKAFEKGFKELEQELKQLDPADFFKDFGAGDHQPKER